VGRRERFSSPQLWFNLPFALDLEPGLLGFQSLLRISVLKKKWNILSINKRKMEGGGGFPLISPQDDYVFLSSCSLNSGFTFISPEGIRN